MITVCSLYIALFTIGYFLGSIPFGYLVGRIKNVDIRQFGSGNIGTTNVFRKFGFIYAFLAGILDLSKAYLFVAIIFSLTNIPSSIKIILSFAPIIGHIFPVWLKFKGGKGVASIFGLLIAIFGWKFTIIWFTIWTFLLLTTHLMSLNNLAMSLTIPLLFWFHFKTITATILGFGFTLIIWWTHRSNIQKLFKGTENKIYLFKNNKI